MQETIAEPSHEDIVEELIELWRTEYPDQNIDFARYYKWSIQMLAIRSIRHHAPAEPQKAVGYAELMLNGMDFRPVVVIDSGKHLDLVDGFHRIHAHKLNGDETVVAYVGRPR